MKPGTFVKQLLQWYEHHGRADLPWKHDPTPYRVWISEIMLQQTQVTTVIPYYERFMARFPDVVSLADAEQDEVLHLWSGLGYYARARNLHRAAARVRDEYGGQFPDDIEAIADLPGIGWSTAGAIQALARGRRHAILDGNVKRVLSRFHAVEGWPGQTAVSRQLWALSERYTPSEWVSDYTQAIMDLGAMVCTRTNPDCEACPVSAGCAAYAAGNPTAYPTSKPRKDRPVREVCMLMLCNDRGEVLLEKRPPTGIWGGLWAFPEVNERSAAIRWCRDHLGCEATIQQVWPSRRHSFTHFHLDITPIVASARDVCGRIMEDDGLVWYNNTHPDPRGLAAPVNRLLEQLHEMAKGDEDGPYGPVREVG